MFQQNIQSTIKKAKSDVFHPFIKQRDALDTYAVFRHFYRVFKHKLNVLPICEQ